MYNQELLHLRMFSHYVAENMQKILDIIAKSQ